MQLCGSVHAVCIIRAVVVYMHVCALIRRELWRRDKTPAIPTQALFSLSLRSGTVRDRRLLRRPR